MVDVLLRAASGPSVGLGHVVRTAAVAAAIVEKGGTPLVIVDDLVSARALQERGLFVRVATAVDDWCELPAASAWLDGFRDWAPELSRLGASGTSRFLVENRTAARAQAERLVYPALHHVNDAWDDEHVDRVLGGAEWIPLSPTVLATARQSDRDIDLLITFGGSDPQELTERCLRLFSGSSLRIVVSIGDHMVARRQRIVALAGPSRATVLETGEPLTPWMARSRAALTALGTTLYELAYLGTPSGILANYPSDAEALAYYGVHGPHLPLGVAREVQDGALSAFVSEMPAPDFRIPGLGGGSARLAAQLLSGESGTQVA